MVLSSLNALHNYRSAAAPPGLPEPGDGSQDAPRAARGAGRPRSLRYGPCCRVRVPPCASGPPRRAPAGPRQRDAPGRVGGSLCCRSAPSGTAFRPSALRPPRAAGGPGTDGGGRSAELSRVPGSPLGRAAPRAGLIPRPLVPGRADTCWALPEPLFQTQFSRVGR